MNIKYLIKNLKDKIKYNLNLTYLFLFANIIVFLAMELSGGSTNYLVLIKYGALYKPLVEQGEIWRFITAAFLHIGIIHLAVNSFTLYQIGPIIETYYGKMKFLIFYILTAISASLLSTLLTSNKIAAGASGALFGLIGIILGNQWKKNPFSAKLPIDQWQVIPFVILNLLLGFISSGIDNWAHFGGLLGGILLGFLIEPEDSYLNTKTIKLLTKFLGIISIIILIISFIFWFLNLIV